MMNKTGLRKFLNLFYPIFVAVFFLLLIPIWNIIFFLKEKNDFSDQLKVFFPFSPAIFLFVLFLIYSVGIVIILVLELLIRTRKDYLFVKSATGDIFLKEDSLRNFIRDSLLEINGVDSLDVEVDILMENAISLSIWVYSTEKTDFVRFSERIQQRVIQDLEFNFGIKKIRSFKVFLESTHIHVEKQPIRVHFE